MVMEVFKSVAPRYDLMNDLMSLGIHRLWKRRFVAKLKVQPGERVLDLAGGTGDIAALIKARTPSAHVTLSDINPAMMKAGQARALDSGHVGADDYVLANAEKLPFKDKSFDVVTIAFGLRNVTQIDAALNEARRVLKPGGRFFCLEFSRVMKPLRPLYDVYSFAVLPRLGKYVANDEASYRYLAESIRQFPSQPDLAARMKKAGFDHVSWLDLSGGIAAIHEGHKEKK
jgi:demethylmenaquinone methyltransferase/2-methoxy-6-polyprenyl-1,4-benzoquinol methylase